MKINLTRQACSAQDDQLSPLEMNVELDGMESFESFIERVVASGFLQLLSTCMRIKIFARDRKLANMASDFNANVNIIFFHKKMQDSQFNR